MATQTGNTIGSSLNGVNLPGAASTGYVNSLQLPGAIGGNPQQNLLGTGGTGGVLGELYGQVPGVADPTASAGAATVGNRQNLQDIANLSYGADTISAAGAALPFSMNLPDYSGMLQSASGNTSAELSGEVPQDVVNLLQQQGAERGAATGQGPNSPNTNAAYLQALGLTSIGQQQTGQSNLSSLIGETPTGASFSPATMFVTPEQEQSAMQAVQNAEAAPDPAASGLFSSIMSLL